MGSKFQLLQFETDENGRIVPPKIQSPVQTLTEVCDYLENLRRIVTGPRNVEGEMIDLSQDTVKKQIMAEANGDIRSEYLGVWKELAQNQKKLCDIGVEEHWKLIRFIHKMAKEALKLYNANGALESEEVLLRLKRLAGYHR